MKKLISLALALLLVIFTTSCKKEQKDTTQIRVVALNGTTGLGMVKLMEDAENGSNPYQISVQTDASLAMTALTSGTADIAALPTNAASLVYNKTNGGVKVLAINTLGCLYLLNATGTPVSSLSDLAGKTVYVPAQNPNFLFSYLVSQSEVNVKIDSTSYASAQNLLPVIASGQIDYAVLPEPMVTKALAKAKTGGKTLTVDLDLSSEWDKIPGRAGSLVQGCLVVRTAFLEEHPEAVAQFLASYEASISFLSDPTAASLVVKHGLMDSAETFAAALPRCNVTFLDGAEMKTALSSYLEVLFSVAPSSIGGKLPGDDFYYEK